MTEKENEVNQESPKNQNVASIETARNRRGRTKPKPQEGESSTESSTDKEKYKKSDCYEFLYRALTHSKQSLLDLPPFHIATIEVADGLVLPVQLLGDHEKDILTCKRLVGLEPVQRLILKYIRTELAGEERYSFTPEDLANAAKYWYLRADPLKKIPLVLFKDQPGLCWNRVPFDLAPGPCPTFDELFSRMTNSRAVKAWIGSLFIGQSYDQQYVWLRGEGGDGKSSLMEFLAKVFGEEGSLSQHEAPGEDKHWAEAWIGKRFVYFPDFEDVYALKKGPLKMITGGDRVPVRPMYKVGSFHVKLPSKLMFSSNPAPKFEFNRSDKRRLIYAELSAHAFDLESTYHEKLWNEGGAFLYSCLQVYHELCPRHGAIPVDDDSFLMLEELRDRSDSYDFRLWANMFFEKGAHFECTATEVADAIALRFAGDFKARGAAYTWLERKGFKNKQYKKDGKQYRAYKGFRRSKLSIEQSSDPNFVPKDQNW